MNILHLLLTGHPGGIETLCNAIVCNSEQRNHLYFLFDGGPFAEQAKEHAVSVVVAGCPRYSWKKSVDDFCSYCKKHKIDVVINHINSPVACVHAICLKKRIPSIKLLGYMHSDQRGNNTELKRRFVYKPFIREMFRHCEKIIAISEFVRQSGLETFQLKPDKVSVVYNGVDCRKFTPTKKNKSETMELIYVGRLSSEKGVDILLDALTQIPKDMPVRVKIVGYGSDQVRLRIIAEEKALGDKVTFLGLRTDVPQLLAESDFFVHPAICQEGFGITLVEALAAGKPCIASEGGAIPEILNSSCGYLFKLGSSKALADKIVEAFNCYTQGDYQSMVIAARERALFFDIRNTTKSLDALCEQCSS